MRSCRAFVRTNGLFIGADGRLRRLSPRARRALRRAARLHAPAVEPAPVTPQPENHEPPKGKPEPPRALSPEARETALRISRSRFGAAEIARLLRVTPESVERALIEENAL